MTDQRDNRKPKRQKQETRKQASKFEHFTAEPNGKRDVSIRMLMKPGSRGA